MKEHARPTPTGRKPSPEPPAAADDLLHPGDYENAWGDAVAHDSPTLEQAANATNEAPFINWETEIDVLATSDAPLSLDGPGRPDEEQLFVEVDDGAPITAQRGTVESPLRTGRLVDEPLFIEGAPTASDVQQGGIGDCYFLAAVLAILSSDPGKIAEAISLDGDVFTARLHRWDEGEQGYVQVDIKVDAALAQYRDPQDIAQLQGSHFRLGENPESAEWFGELDGTTIETWQRAEFEAGMWAPLLEKAYAAFAAQYSQYGGAPVAGGLQQGAGPLTQGAGEGEGEAEEEAAGPTSGYELIDGGWEHMVYGMFYGDNVLEARRFEMTKQLTPAGSAVGHEATIRTLLMLQGKGLEDGQVAMITASAQQHHTVQRLLAQLALAEAALVSPAEQRGSEIGASIGEFLGGWARGPAGAIGGRILGGGLGARVGREIAEAGADGDAVRQATALRGELPSLRDRIIDWQDDDSDVNLDALTERAAEIVAPDAFPILFADDAPHELRALLELALMVTTLGSDTSAGQRHIYALHAYTVQEVWLRDPEGQALDLDPATLAESLERIDTERSNLLIRNPHRTNEPDVQGHGPEDGVDDGEFVLTLDQFFRSFDAMDVAVVETGAS